MVVKLINFWPPVLVLEKGIPLLSIKHPNNINAVRVISECAAKALNQLHSQVLWSDIDLSHYRVKGVYICCCFI